MKRISVNRLTDHQLHRIHKALWHWLARNPGMFKAAWPGWDTLSYTPRNLCMACLLAERRAMADNIDMDKMAYCVRCPVKTWRVEEWAPGPGYCIHKEFGSWTTCNSSTDRNGVAKYAAKYAAIIADIDWTTEDEWAAEKK